MPAKKIRLPSVIGKRWVHRFEEDTAQGEVYRPETEDVPLSRRPREAFELDAGGGARLYLAGADDRLAATPATWTQEEGAIVLRTAAGRGQRPVEFRIVEATRDRLLVRR
jgi:hypothetical protein